MAAIFHPEEGWRIEEFDVAQRHWRQLSSGTGINVQPTYSRDGNSVFYSADLNGIYNLHRIDLLTGNTQTLTRTVGGAFYPDEAEDGVYYLGYHHPGYDVFYLPRAQFANLPVQINNRKALLSTESETFDNITLSQDTYHPLHHMLPRWWFPVIAFGDDMQLFGLMTGSNDPLQRHGYDAQLAYDVGNDQAIYSLAYSYDRWFPTLRGLYAKQPGTMVANNGTSLESLNDTAEFEAVFPLLRANTQTRFHFAVLQEVEKTIEKTNVTESIRSENSYLGAGISYNSARLFQLKNSVSHGRTLSASITDSNAIQSDRQGQIARANWREYIGIGTDSVLALSGAFGFGIDDTKTFNLGNHVSATSPFGEDYENMFNSQHYMLRGYPTRLARLSGRRMALASVELHLPPFRIQQGIMSPPMGIKQMSTAIFVDTGSAWNIGKKPDEPSSGIGAELNIDSQLFYRMPLFWRIGAAKGLNEDGELSVYIATGRAF